MGTFWLIVAVIFGVCELMTSGLAMIWFSIGAIILMIFSIFIESILWQIILFALISFSLLFVGTRYLVNRDKDVKYDTNLQAIIDKTGVVMEDIEPYNTGLVKLSGEMWTSIAVDDDITIKKGSIVRVVDIDGVKLVVEPVEIDNSDEDDEEKRYRESISKELNLKIKTK